MSLVPGFDALGLPAPLWLLFSLKVFGFWLHQFFMNLWLAGLPVALLLARRPGAAGEAGSRLLKGMPIFIALGVNLGIVPLLFLQVLYPQFFYTSTILQAWPWFTVLVLVLIAYYAVYVHVLGTKAGRTDWKVRLAGPLASVLFLIVGLIFVSEMHLLTRPMDWATLAPRAVGGTVGGAALALWTEPLLRFVMMFGIALGTTAGYLALDANFFRRAEGAAAGIRSLVLGLALAGVALFGLAGLGYIASIGYDLSQLGASGIAAALTPPLVVLGALLYFLRPGRALALLLLLVQLGTLLANAIERQIVQFREIAAAFDLGTVPVNVQWSPIILFVVTLVVGLGVVGWLLRLFVRAAAAPPATPAQPGMAAAGPA